MGLYGELGLLRRFSSAHKDRVQSALTDVDMADFAARQISQLSGGQQQRVFLARSIVQDAELILLDEPFGAYELTLHKYKSLQRIEQQTPKNQGIFISRQRLGLLGRNVTSSYI